MANVIKKDLKFTPRKEQSDALDFMKDVIINQPDKKFIMLDLPVGVGKSYLALMLADWYLDNVKSNARFDIITNSKMLQHQYLEFETINNLMGKDNYTCAQFETDCATGKKLCDLNKTKCEFCPYTDAVKQYTLGTVSLTNFHFFVLLQMYVQKLVNMRSPDVLILDEAHDFETIFSDFITISLSEYNIKRLKLENASRIIDEINHIDSLDMFIEFASGYLKPTIMETILKLSREAAENFDDEAEFENRKHKVAKVAGKSNKIKKTNTLDELGEYVKKIDNFCEDFNKNRDNWIFEKVRNKNGNFDIVVQPLWVDPYLDKLVWSRYKHVIFMSGTILDKNLFSYLNGIDPNKAVYYSITSPFNVKNRPIYYAPIGKLTYKNKTELFPKFIPIIEKLLQKYKADKGIIHTVTYEISEWVKTQIQDPRLLFHESSVTKGDTIQKHYDTDEPTVLVSPAMGTGLSLEDDKARFQILLKVPYPSLGSKKNQLRQKIKPQWYAWRVICAIVQAYGRAIRNYNDKADFFILDECFSDVVKHSSYMIPDYVAEAITRVNVKS